MRMAFASLPSPLGAAIAVGMASAASAEGLVCTAETQCRGDAERMCAPSTLEISVKAGGGTGTQLFIDHQGPYAARATRKDGTRHYEVTAFGGRHRLEIDAENRFLYLGNRGKRYTGLCKEMP